MQATARSSFAKAWQAWAASARASSLRCSEAALGPRTARFTMPTAKKLRRSSQNCSSRSTSSWAWRTLPLSSWCSAPWLAYGDMVIMRSR